MISKQLPVFVYFVWGLEQGFVHQFADAIYQRYITSATQAIFQLDVHRLNLYYLDAQLKLTKSTHIATRFWKRPYGMGTTPAANTGLLKV